MKIIDKNTQSLERLVERSDASDGVSEMALKDNGFASKLSDMLFKGALAPLLQAMGATKNLIEVVAEKNKNFRAQGGENETDNIWSKLVVKFLKRKDFVLNGAIPA